MSLDYYESAMKAAAKKAQEYLLTEDTNFRSLRADIVIWLLDCRRDDAQYVAEFRVNIFIPGADFFPPGIWEERIDPRQAELSSASGEVFRNTISFAHNRDYFENIVIPDDDKLNRIEMLKVETARILIARCLELSRKLSNGDTVTGAH